MKIESATIIKIVSSISAVDIAIFFQATDALKSEEEIAKKEKERLDELEVSFHFCNVFTDLVKLKKSKYDNYLCF